MKDICAFLPYYGTQKDYFYDLEDLGKKLAEYTGGELKTYKGAEATIDRLADALETCAVVLIGSHGLNGSFSIQNTSGLTSEDYENGHTVKWGDDGGAVFYGIDGTVIANHMTKDAPNSLVILDNCMSMKNDRLCAPLRGKGVAVLYGYSESVSTSGSADLETSFVQALCEGKTVVQAISAMRQETDAGILYI